MKIKTVTPVAFTLFAILIISVCKKEMTSSVVSENEYSLTDCFTFSSRKPAEKHNGRITTCPLTEGDSTCGWDPDPDSAIIEGSCNSAIIPTFESVAENCIDVKGKGTAVAVVGTNMQTGVLIRLAYNNTA